MESGDRNEPVGSRQRWQQESINAMSHSAGKNLGEGTEVSAVGFCQTAEVLGADAPMQDSRGRAVADQEQIED